MIKYYKTINGKIKEQKKFTIDSWIHVVAPNEEEIMFLVKKFKLEREFITAALDIEEMSRVEKEEQDTLIIIDTPITVSGDKSARYTTVPIGIISTKGAVITITRKKNQIFDDFINNKVKDLNTGLKTRFILQLLFKSATLFLKYLTLIDRMSTAIENNLRKSMKNKELVQMLELEKSLVYFNTSLKSNSNTTRKLTTGRFVKLYDEDKDLLDDVLIEFSQASEMAGIYFNILSETMDAYASIISNNLNVVMRILASITIVISIPTIVSSFYGMNVAGIPFPTFWFPLGLSCVLMLLIGLLLFKKNMFQ